MIAIKAFVSWERTGHIFCVSSTSLSVKPLCPHYLREACWWGFVCQLGFFSIITLLLLRSHLSAFVRSIAWGWSIAIHTHQREAVIVCKRGNRYRSRWGSQSSRTKCITLCYLQFNISLVKKKKRLKCMVQNYWSKIITLLKISQKPNLTVSCKRGQLSFN